jgi:hypothetical protein
MAQPTIEQIDEFEYEEEIDEPIDDEPMEEPIVKVSGEFRSIMISPFKHNEWKVKIIAESGKEMTITLTPPSS